MDTVTYPSSDVIRVLNDRFVPLKLKVEENATLAEEFHVIWTPAFLCLDANRRVWVRTYGYLPPEEFIPFLWLTEGRYRLGGKQYAEATKIFEDLVLQWSKSHAAAEALYWEGVAYYRLGRTGSLMQSWQRLKEEYPQSIWHLKSSFIFQ
ncbi:MAG: tetratricopeptide repeat protein [Cyanobacteria bacterium NC_groundwater_1444_Ag_S-0.65um_54_12]|nr:tetratricopeptide repeat protein [Cyanobacteria bacterium NC_groundwater_1444_Ag_S-0.65um_54_12]